MASRRTVPYRCERGKNAVSADVEESWGVQHSVAQDDGRDEEDNSGIELRGV
jgi:hypothetical protein